MEVEPSRAARAVLRPDDVGAAGGWYKINPMSGLMTAGLGANATIFSWRNGNPPANGVCSIRRVRFSAGCGSTAFTAGQFTVQLYKCTTWTASDSAQTVALPAAGNKLKGTYPNSFMQAANNCDIRIASTAGITLGTRTLDAFPLGVFTTGLTNTAGWPITPGKVDLLEQRGWEFPLILAQNEGFVVNATVPATGTWQFDTEVLWAELPSGQY
jgi:hypothetical protein